MAVVITTLTSSRNVMPETIAMLLVLTAARQRMVRTERDIVSITPIQPGGLKEVHFNGLNRCASDSSCPTTHLSGQRHTPTEGTRTRIPGTDVERQNYLD